VVGLFVGLKVLADSTGFWDHVHIPFVEYLFWPVALFASFRAATETVVEAEEEAAIAEAVIATE